MEGKGTQITREAQHAASMKGLRASMALHRRCSQLGIHDPALKLQLFHVLVAPVVLYGCEIWGVGVKLKEVENVLTHLLVAPVVLYGCEIWGIGVKLKEVENVLTHFLRRILGVRKSTPMTFLCQEVGMFPLAIAVMKQALKFHERLQDIDEERLLAKAW